MECRYLYLEVLLTHKVCSTFRWSEGTFDFVFAFGNEQQGWNIEYFLNVPIWYEIG